MILALRKELGGWGLRGLLRQMLVLLVYRRLGRICGQMERLAQRFQAGRLGSRRLAVARGVAASGVKRATVPVRLRRRFGWLVRAAAWQAAGYGSQLQTVLGQPEMVELLKAAPQAARILRPVCRMLAIETSLLRPGVAVVAKPVAVVKVRVRRPRVPVDWGRIPLPRGVLTAARRQGFGKVPRG